MILTEQTTFLDSYLKCTLSTCLNLSHATMEINRKIMLIKIQVVNQNTQANLTAKLRRDASPLCGIISVYILLYKLKCFSLY